MKILNQITSQVGLDIGTSGVRIVELELSKKGTRLLHFAKTELDKNISEAQTVETRQELIKSIKKLVHDSTAMGKKAILNIPISMTSSFLIKTTKSSEDELVPIVRKRVEQSAEMPLSQLSYDWLITDSELPQNQIEVLIAVCAKARVQHYASIANESGLNTIAVEPEGLSLARNLAPVSKAGRIIVELGAMYTNIIFVYRSTPRIMRSITIGGETIISELVKNIAVEPDQARQFIFSFGLNASRLEGQVQRNIKSCIDKIIEEIKSVKAEFLANYKDAEIEQIVISGGSSQIPGLPSYLANETTLPVEIGNSWSGITYDVAWQDKLLQESSQFSVATGLAQRKVEKSP